MDHICQKSLPEWPWRVPAMARLPGVQPLDFAAWLAVDEAFAGQIALRDRMLAKRRADVFACQADAVPACVALRDLIIAHLGAGYAVSGSSITRPDGVVVDVTSDHPLVTAARLVQEDLCLMEPDGQGQHRLTAAVLCFPASWSLHEKMGRPLDAIHAPVDRYDPAMATRVQRLFDAIRPERPLYRQNALLYADPTLYQPRPAAAPRDRTVPPEFLRSERQCLVRLPDVDAVAFTIHTYVVPLGALPPEARAGLNDLETAG